MLLSSSTNAELKILANPTFMLTNLLIEALVESKDSIASFAEPSSLLNHTAWLNQPNNYYCDYFCLKIGMLSYIFIVLTYYWKNHNNDGNFEILLFSEMIFENSLLQIYFLFKLEWFLRSLGIGKEKYINVAWPGEKPSNARVYTSRIHRVWECAHVISQIVGKYS